MCVCVRACVRACVCVVVALKVLSREYYSDGEEMDRLTDRQVDLPTVRQPYRLIGQSNHR